jgi:hypothetical protein
LVWHYPLAVQFWELYCICNEKTKSIAEVWVEGEMRLSFRRSFSENMLQVWNSLCDVVESLVLNNDSDALVWEYEKSRIYSSQSLYAVISFRGVTYVHIPAIWSIMVPPKIQLFLWLLSHNKLATVDNLNKRGLQNHLNASFLVKMRALFTFSLVCGGKGNLEGCW